MSPTASLSSRSADSVWEQPVSISETAAPSSITTKAADYVPTSIERFGRKMKLEYIGMCSVYLIIGLLVFSNAPNWYDALFGALGAFLLFLGIKKKTRDHISGSILVIAATVLARGAVLDANWSFSFLAFASCLCAMEGYLEKRQEQSLALPAIFLLWIFVDLSWIPALTFVSAYLLYPWTERPGLRRRLVWLISASAVIAIGGTMLGFGVAPDLLPMSATQRPLDSLQIYLLISMGVPTALALMAYWKRVLPTHRVNTILFGICAPWDERLLAMFGMVAIILLSATVFRQSVDHRRLRPYFKHAEWIYFWILFGVAIGALFYI